MPISTKVSGAWKTVSIPSVKVSGSWKTVSAAWVKVSGAWKIFHALAVEVSLDTTSVSGVGDAPGPVQTDRVFADPSGGIGPYTVFWERVSGDETTSPNDTGAASVYFDATGAAGTTKSSVWRCKATDSVGTIGYSGNVSVSIQFN
jgi:hypothetical protein